MVMCKGAWKDSVEFNRYFLECRCDIFWILSYRYTQLFSLSDPCREYFIPPRHSPLNEESTLAKYIQLLSDIDKFLAILFLGLASNVSISILN